MPLSLFMNPEWIEGRLASTTEFYNGETLEQHRTGYNALKQAIDQIPSDMKAALIEAWRKCPDLVTTESDPIQFLRCEDFSPWAAAFRLALYWKMRKECFEERAFLAIASTDGHCALNSDDVHLLQSGFRVVLPEDNEGSPVLLTDSSKIAKMSDAKDFSLPNRMRSSFFLSTILCQNIQAQTTGVVVIFIMRERDVNRFSPLPFEIYVKACPFKIKSVYSVQAIDDNSKEDFIQHVMPTAVQLTATFFGKASIPVFGDTKEEILEKLVGHGLRKEACPPSCGGSWDPQEFLEKHGLLPSRDNTGNHTADSSSSQALDEDAAKNRQQQNAEALLKFSEVMSGKMSSKDGPGVTEAVEKEALLQLEDALSVIPDMDKMDYLNVKAVNLPLVSAESDPILFLRTEKYNPWAAARRLVSYWKERRVIFGEKAFDPITYDSLSEGAQELINCRCLEFLPNDAEGRAVVCFNSALGYGEGKEHITDHDRLAAFFYWMRIAAENPKSQIDSLVTIHRMAGGEQIKGSTTRGLRMFTQIFPVRWNKAHFVCIKPTGGESAKSYFGPIFRILTEFVAENQGPQLWVHVTDSSVEMLARLDVYGLKKESLPDTIGGALGDGYFASFREDRRAIDSQIVADLQLKSNRFDNRKRDSPASTDEDGSGSNAIKRPKKDNKPSNTVLYEYEDSETFVETPSMIQKGLEELEAAIDLLPEEDRAVLLEARQEVPDLVEKETPSIRFLRVERYNAWAAARRLAMYWKERRSVFGDNAFLPLNQTGEGALTREDVVFINSGFFALLGIDKQGRSVIFHDSSRRTSHLREPRLRAVYYFWTLLSENEVSQIKGYQLITVLGKPFLDTVIADAERLIAECMPTRVDAMHICNVPSVSERKSFMETMLPVLYRQIGGLKKRSHVHVGETKEDISKKLLAFDFTPETIPKSLGGTWGYEEFSKWQEARLRYEWDLPPASKDHENPNIPKYHAKSLAEMTEEEKVERKRRMNVLHARRRRERERIEMEVFAEQVAELQDENARLCSQNKTLEGLLSSAKLEVAKIESAAQLNSVRQAEVSDASAAAARGNLTFGSDFGRTNNWGLQLLLNNNSQSNGQHINLQNFLAASQNGNFETATGMTEPSSFSLTLENQQQLANTLALQQAQERHLFALGQQQQHTQHLGYGPASSSLSSRSPFAMDYQQQQQQQQQHQAQQQNLLSNLVTASWFKGQGQPPQPR